MTLNSGTGTEQRVSDSVLLRPLPLIPIQQYVEHYTDIKAIVNKDKCSQEVCPLLLLSHSSQNAHLATTSLVGLVLITDWQKKLLPIFKNLKIGRKI